MKPRLALLSGALVSALGCEYGPDHASQAEYGAIWQQGRPLAASEQRAQPELAPGAIHVMWFGHSLLKAPGGWPRPEDPELDIPATVAELHRLARADGRTSLPEGRSFGYAEGPHDLSYWLDGPGRARDKLLAHADTPLTYVVGIGFMHVLGRRSYAWPTLSAWLHWLLPRRYGSPQVQTAQAYRMMKLVREVAAGASWVNYMGPALANATDTQPAIDARFECMRVSAERAGVRVRNVPVGAAIRAAERAAREHPELSLAPQQPDHLHLTAQGGLLAGSVFYEALYGVSVLGLPLPGRFRGQLGAREDEVAALLQRVAHDSVRNYHPPACATKARVPEDDEAEKLLSRRP